MKFIIFWEYDPQNSNIVFKKMQEMNKLSSSKKYPKVLSGPYHFSGEFKGIILCEADSDEQIVNLHAFYQPELIFNFVPLLDLKVASEFIVHK